MLAVFRPICVVDTKILYGYNLVALLNQSLKPIPEKYPVKTPSLPTVSATRKPLTERIFEEDQYQQFLTSDTVACLESLNEAVCPPSYSFSKGEDYKILLSEQQIAEITETFY